MAINLDHVTEQITVTDTATDVDLTFVSKGAGSINLNTGGGTQVKVLNATTVDYIAMGGFNTRPLISFTGANANISGLYVTTGSGAHDFSTGGNAGNQQFKVSHTASAVNFLQASGNTTGNTPIISAQGSDTNIGLAYITKGTGSHFFYGPSLPSFQVNSQPVNANYGIFTSTATGVSPLLQVSGTDTNVDFRFRTQGTGGYQFDTGSNANSQLRLTNTASAVNYVQVTGAATGGAPVISALGSDTNVRLVVTSKGGSAVDIYTGNAGAIQARFAATGNGVNYLQLGGANTTFGPIVSSAGSDTNIPLVLQPKGTGALQAQQTDSTVTGGNTRGANAVDWQTVRSSASQVAANTGCVIGGGSGNTASSLYSGVASGLGNLSNNLVTIVAGGQANSASGGYSSVVGGVSNTASAYMSIAGGGYGNTASGYFNFIGGGFTNSATSNSAVTTQSGTMNGTTAVTLSGSNASIKVGQYITGTSIAAETYVAAISGTSLTLSKIASGSSTSTLSFFTPHGVVVGGGNNTATGSYSFIGGGGDAGTASNRNVASGDWSFVGGGTKNVASGQGSVVAGGGFELEVNFGNTASGNSSFVGGGILNVASGTGSAIISGWQNTASGTLSNVIGGRFGFTRAITGNIVFPACNVPVIDALGVSQSALLVLGRQTTDATATRLTSDSGSASTTNQVILPNNAAYFFTGEVVAGVTGGGNTKGWTIEGVIKRGANAASTALVGTPTVTSTYADAGASTWVIAVTADTTNGGLAVTFTGQAATTIRTVAQIRTTEMTY